MEKKKPEIRFNGFEGEWEIKELREVAEFAKGKGYAKGDLTKEGIPIIRYGSLYTDYRTEINSVSEYVQYSEGAIFSRGGEVIIPASGETSEDIARASAVKQPNIILGGDLNIIYPNAEIDAVFLALEITYGKSHTYLAMKAQGASVVHLRKLDISTLSPKFPSIPEQEKIGLFLTTLDKLIAKLEAKLDKLRKLKQALLEKMFTNVNRGGYETPEIRFKGYTDKWLTTTLGACSKKIITKNNGNEYNIVLTNSAERGIVDQRSYFDREIVNTENIQGYYIVSQDDFVYNPRISMQAPVGPINRSKFEYTGVMSPLYYVFRITDKRFSLTYMEWFFKSSSWYDFMYKNGNSGARSDRFAINDDAFLRLPIYHPKDISEQEQIGKCFTQIDTHFSKTSTKVTKLRNIKQSLLQKMFA